MVVVDFIERGREMGAIRWASWEKFALYLVDIYICIFHPSRLFGLWNFFKFTNIRGSMDRNKGT